MAASLGKMPTTLVRRLTSAWSRSIGFVECNFWRCSLGKWNGRLPSLMPEVARVEVDPHRPTASKCQVGRASSSHSNGISALQLQKQLALGSYRTAWMLAAKLRRAMVDPDRNPLSGLVEIDETSLPFRTKNDPAGGGPGRSHDGKLLVVGGIEVGDGNKPGRLRLAALTDYGAGSLNAFIARNIAPASTAKTEPSRFHRVIEQ